MSEARRPQNARLVDKISRVRRIVTLATSATVSVALAGCGGGAGFPNDVDSQVSASGDDGVVNIGFLYDVHSVNVWSLDECTQELNIELTSFKQFAEVQRAFEQGQINAAAMGYQNSAQMLENGYDHFKIVSGVYTGAQHITVRKGSGIETWQDLVGRSVGVPPNSFVEMLFKSSLEEQGVDYDDIDIVPFAGAGPPMLAALESGDVDAIVAWESNSATAEVDGIGEYPPFDIQEGSIGDATSALYVSTELTDQSPETVQILVDCLAERTEALSADREQWLQKLLENTGLQKEVANRAIDTGEMDTTIYQESAQRIVKTFADNGLISDLSEEIVGHIDDQYIAKLTE